MILNKRAGEKPGPEAGLPVELQELSSLFALAETDVDRAGVFHELLGLAAKAIQGAQDANEVVKQYEDEANTARQGVVEAEARSRKAEDAAARLARDKEELQARLTNSGVTNQRLVSENQELRAQQIEQRAALDRLERVLEDPEPLLRELVRTGFLSFSARLGADGPRVWAERSKDGVPIGTHEQMGTGFVTFGKEVPDMDTEVRISITRTKR